MLLQRTEYRPVRRGLYEATIASVVAGDLQYGPQLEFLFELRSGQRLRAWTTPTLSARSKLGAWATALFGELPESLDTDALVGLSCRVQVGVRQREDGSSLNTIDSVLAPTEAQSGGVVVGEGVESIPF